MGHNGVPALPAAHRQRFRGTLGPCPVGEGLCALGGDSNIVGPGSACSFYAVCRERMESEAPDHQGALCKRSAQGRVPFEAGPGRYELAYRLWGETKGGQRDRGQATAVVVVAASVPASESAPAQTGAGN